jgi:gamma-glutamyltranspeptidase/glutathione hydrolase
VKRCVIATGHEEVSRAASLILEEGGNAFDAAVAAAFASHVAEPTLTDLGGGGFIMCHTAGGEDVLVDFFTDTPGHGIPGEIEIDFRAVTVRFPGADQVFHVGPGAAAVPGVLKGLAHVAERFGRMPLARLVEPAIALARDGVKITELQRSFIQLLWPILTLTESSRAIYEPLPEVGGQLDMSDTARFLEDVPKGGLESFYGGELAQRIHDDMREQGGLLTREDLEKYKVIEREPLRYRYADHVVMLNPPPSGGGARIARYLETLAAHEEDLTDEANYVTAVAEAVALVEREVIGEIEGEAQPSFSRGTTHLTVADDEGNVAAMTTSNGEGCAYMVPGTGIMLNNMLGEDDLHPGGFERYPPGRRVSSMMCPTVLLKDGAPAMALGSGGSQRIRTAVTQVLTRVLDRGMSLEEAVTAPRVHFDGTDLQVEPGLSEAAVQALKASFPDLNLWDRQNLYFGGVHAVTPDEAAGDPRRGGVARAFERKR